MLRGSASVWSAIGPYNGCPTCVLPSGSLCVLQLVEETAVVSAVYNRAPNLDLRVLVRAEAKRFRTRIQPRNSIRYEKKINNTTRKDNTYIICAVYVFPTAIPFLCYICYSLTVLFCCFCGYLLMFSFYYLFVSPLKDPCIEFIRTKLYM